MLNSDLLAWSHMAKRLCNVSMGSMIEEFGLNHMELGILMFLYKNPEADTSRDISDALMLAKSNISTAVENMVQRGYLRRQADPKDRRVIHLKLESAAQQLAERGDALHQQQLDQLLTGFSPEEREKMGDYCKRILANMHELLDRQSYGPPQV